MNVRNVYTQQCKLVSWDSVIVPEKTEYFVFEKCTSSASVDTAVWGRHSKEDGTTVQQRTYSSIKEQCNEFAHTAVQ